MEDPQFVEMKKKLARHKAADKHRSEHIEFMARMFSHNLRSPVAGMKMLFSLLDRVSEDEKEEIMDNLKEASTLLFDMIDDLATVLLDYRQLIEGLEPVNVQSVLDEVHRNLSSKFEQGPYQMEVNLEVPELNYYPQHLKVILKELLSNCLKFSKTGQPVKIIVHTYRDDDKVMLSVKDQGVGIDMETFAKDVFKMYKPLQMEKEGTDGVGLFRIKNIVEIHGGKVHVKSEPGEGTEVLMELYREEATA